MRIRLWLALFTVFVAAPAFAQGTSNSDIALNANSVVALLDLEAHIEGGYFKQTYKAESKIPTPHGERVTMTSIFYMLTEDSPIGQFHINKSDIVHYYHAGNPIEYIFIRPDGEVEKHILGPDIHAGHKMQLIVPGGYWKAARLASTAKNDYDFGLLGDAVAPGFDYKDMRIAKRVELTKQFPQHAELIVEFTRY